MKKTLLSLLAACMLSLNGFSQDMQAFYADSAVYLVTGSGMNQLLIANIHDGDELYETIIITAVPEDTSLLKVASVTMEENDHFAVINLVEQGVPGTVNLFVSVTDDDGTSTDTVVVNMGPYKQTGMFFEIHDAVFWQEVVPVNGTPIYTQLIQSGAGPYTALDYSNIPLTVSADCGPPAPCTGHDFYTAFYRGYIVPAVSGDYRFTVRSQDAHGFWLSTDSDPAHATKISFRSTKEGVLPVGTNSGQETESAPVNLVAGKVYAFYATQWIIHTTLGGILMSGPGITKDYIPGTLTLPVYDAVRPVAPSSVSLAGLSSTGVVVKWNNGTDNVKVLGYNIYLDGKKLNSDLLSENTFTISDLTPDSTYAVSITSVDKMGNESLLGPSTYIETYPLDAVAPQPPVTVETILATGQALKIRWSGASDQETAVVGYKLFLDGVLQNPGQLIFEDSLIISGLTPETTYGISLVAVDAGMNESVHSDTFEVQTLNFDPLGPSLGEKRARVKVELKNISWNEGIGLNGPFEDGTMVNNAQVRQLIRDFKPGAIRWGGIGANSMSLAGSSGTGKQNTYARMLNFANEMNVYFALTVGVHDGLDFRTDPNTFANLLEYLAGPSTSTWGAKRAAEGYPEPLLQKGKGILLEFGNEVWGAAAHQAEIGSNYTTYGAWCRTAAEVVRNSPYYDPEKIIMVYSGRNPRPDESYSLNTTVLTGDTGQINCLAVSGYLGGNLNYDPDIPAGKTESEYYKFRIAQAAANIEGLRLTMLDMLGITGSMKTFYLYEANATNPSYNGRLGQAIVMTDYLVTSMRYGSIVPSIFHLTGGEWRITVPSEDYKPLPLYEAAKLFNHFSKGNVMPVLVQTNDFITDGYGKKMSWSPVGSFASNRDTVFSIVLFSRDFEADYTVQLDLPDGITVRNGMKYVLSGSDFSTRDFLIDSASIDLTDSMLVTVPKYSMVLITFRGDDPGFEAKPLGNFDRIRPTSVTIVPETDEHITINRQKLTYLVNVLPENAFYRGIGWKIEPNTLKSIITTSSTRIIVKGSGSCTGNGTLNFAAYALDNKDAHASYALGISNQGLNCGVGVEDLAGGGGLFYPNPANDVLYLNLKAGQEMSIMDMTGRIVKTVPGDNVASVSLKDLYEGVYLIRFSGNGNIETGKLIISR
ncbi:MAG: T9SS type A sorting domain-containing protein [Bacteroidales bacterium]